MKITYTYDPHDDFDELEAVRNVNRLRNAARVALDECRRYLKYHELDEKQVAMLEGIRAAILDELDGFDP